MPQGTEGENLQNQQTTSESSQGQQQSTGVDYSKIDWNTFDWSKVPADAVPDSVVKETKTGKALLQETIERRQTIKQLKEALGEGEKPTTPAKEPAKTDDNVPAWAKQLMQTVTEMQTNTQAGMVKSATDAVMVQYKLPEGAREFIAGSTPAEIEASAKKLATMFTPNDTTSPGNPGTRPEGDLNSRAKAIIEARIKGAKPVADTGSSIFDKSFHRIG